MNTNKSYENKYLKYKNKYLNLRKQIEELNIINDDQKNKDSIDKNINNINNSENQEGGFNWFKKQSKKNIQDVDVNIYIIQKLQMVLNYNENNTDTFEKLKYKNFIKQFYSWIRSNNKTKTFFENNYDTLEKENTIIKQIIIEYIIKKINTKFTIIKTSEYVEKKPEINILLVRLMATKFKTKCDRVNTFKFLFNKLVFNIENVN